MRLGRSIPGSMAALILAIACEDSSSNGTVDAGGSSRGGQAGAQGGAGSGAAGGSTPSGAGGGAAGGGSGNSGTSGASGSAGSGGTGDAAGSSGAGGVTGVAGTDGGFAGDGGSTGDGGGSAGDGGSAGAGNECITSFIEQPPQASCGIYGTVLYERQLGTATETLSFGVQLRAQDFFGPVFVNQIEVHYYFSSEETSAWQASVDSFVQHAPDVDLGATAEISVAELVPHLDNSGVGCQTHFIAIRNSSPAELLPADSNGDPYLEFHVTLTPADSAPPNQNHANDFSHNENLSLGVFLCGQLVNGCTPGDAGTCP